MKDFERTRSPQILKLFQNDHFLGRGPVLSLDFSWIMTPNHRWNQDEFCYAPFMGTKMNSAMPLS